MTHNEQETPMFPLGTRSPASVYHPRHDRDVIGEVLHTQSGNISIRIGHTLPDHGWTQTAYVTLTPDERAHLIEALSAQERP